MYNYSPYLFNYRNPGIRKFVIINKNLDEFIDTQCTKWVDTEFCIWEPKNIWAPWEGMKKVCHPDVPKKEVYNCRKKKITNLIVNVVYTFDNLADFQKPEVYNCFTNKSMLDEAARRFELQIPQGIALTDDLLYKAGMSAHQYLQDTIFCPISVKFHVEYVPTIIKDWHEI